MNPVHPVKRNSPVNWKNSTKSFIILDIMKCATHSDVETNLTCSKCGKPICPRCLVMTPVGARCRECARLTKLPTYRMSARYYLRAVGAALVAAIVCGFIWAMINRFVPMFSFNLLLAPAAAYAISEAITFSTNRKRGTRLAVIAAIALLVSYVITLFFHGGFPASPFTIIYHLAALALGVYIAVIRLR